MAAPDHTKLVPGFDFLQQLMQNAGAAMPALPGMAGFQQWIAPTLDPAEIDKRIAELRAVQFWLEQNARLLAATVQALEVQRMTLATLSSMNMPLADVAASMKLQPTAPPAPAAAPAATPPAPAPAAADPLQWWTALTQQFTTLAASAVKDAAATPPAAPAPAPAAEPAPQPKPPPRGGSRPRG